MPPFQGRGLRWVGREKQPPEKAGGKGAGQRGGGVPKGKRRPSSKAEVVGGRGCWLLQNRPRVLGEACKDNFMRQNRSLLGQGLWSYRGEVRPQGN